MTGSIALDAEIDSALPFTGDADSGTVAGSFILKPVDARVCAAAFESRAAAVGDMQRGDFSPAVARVKKYLSDLGFLLQRSDWYYDKATESAMRAFQRSAGLPISGIADRDTVAKLRLAATARASC
jgi:peptidoglycan hydrolase-like protein with peptidoglycan-binding domain